MAARKKTPAAAAAIPKTEDRKAAAKTSGVFLYLGPTIRGIIQRGSIYRGTREEVVAKLAPAISKYPEIEKLIFADKEVGAAAMKIKSAGNYLNTLFGSIAAKATQ